MAIVTVKCKCGHTKQRRWTKRQLEQQPEVCAREQSQWKARAKEKPCADCKRVWQLKRWQREKRRGPRLQVFENSQFCLEMLGT